MTTPEPSSAYQWLLYFLDSLERLHGDTGLRWVVVSRALGWGVTAASAQLAQLYKRKGAPRPRAAADGVDIAHILAWLRLSARSSPERARERLECLLARMETAVDASEAYVLFHVVATQHGGHAVRELTRVILGHLRAGERTRAERRALKAFVQHAFSDFSVDLADLLEAPEVRCEYEAADYVFNLASAFKTPEAHAALRLALAELARERPDDVFPFVAYLLSVRLGMLPGKAPFAQAHLEHLLGHHGPALAHVDGAVLAQYCDRFDYGFELAQVVRTQGATGHPCDLRPLIDWAHVLVTGGRYRRHRGLPDVGWKKTDALKISRRFAAWGVGHLVCRALVPSIDPSRPPDRISYFLDACGETLMRDRAANEALGGMVLGDLLTREWFENPFA